MKRGTKLLWGGGLALVLSATFFHRVSNSLDTSAAQPRFATLASLYKSSDPHILTTKTETEAATNRIGAASDPGARTNAVKTDFSPYLMLHMTRVDNLVTRDGID